MTGKVTEGTQVAIGLEGVVVSFTRISKVFGEEGRLIYRGYSIDDLAPNTSYEEIAYLLYYEDLPDRDKLREFSAQLASDRALNAGVLTILRALPRTARPMAALRTGVSALAHFDPDAEDMSPEANRRKARRLVAKFPTIVAAFDRLRRGLEPVEPRQDLGHAANFLYMLRGEEPDPTSAKTVNTYLVLLADHGFNASTFAARVTASTLSDMYSAVTTAVAVLKGPAHGGAPSEVMEVLEEIGSPENVETWVERALAKGQRIMGIGHRVYKTWDPRAKHLKRMAEALAQETGEWKWYRIAERLEEVAVAALQREKPEHRLYTNVEFYTGPVLHTLGIATDLLPTMFAISRIAGWTAHILEQYADNRLIRPRAQYVGPTDRTFVPLDRR